MPITTGPRRLSDYYSFRLTVSFLLACVITLALLLIFVPKSDANVPPPNITQPEPKPAQAAPTCQDFASETQAVRVESWRRIFWDGTATSGAPKHAIECAIDYERITAFDTALEVGCKSGGNFQEVFLAEMARHLIPCGFQLQGTQ